MSLRDSSPRHCAYPGNTASVEEMPPQWRAVGNTMSALTGPKFELQISRSRNESVTARLTNQLSNKHFIYLIKMKTNCFYEKTPQ